MGISVSGIASGLDVDSIINQLLQLERRPLIAIQRKVAEAEARKAAFNDLDGRLTSLRNALRGLEKDDLFGKLTASSTDEGVVTVNATAAAPLGNQTLRVLQVATAHRIAAQGFVDKSSTPIAADAGKFSFRVGDDEVSLDIDASTTLAQLAEAINDSGAGVQASIVNDGSATNAFRLVLTSKKAGRDGGITVTENDTTLDFGNKRIEAAVASAANAGDYDGTVTSGGAYTGTANTTFVVQIIQDGAADGTARYKLSTDGGLTFDDNGGLGFAVDDAGPIALAHGVEISFTDSGILRAGDTFNIDVFNPELQTPQDAIIELNGIQIRKSTNTITDVFEGLTLNLHSANPARTVTLSVSQSTGDVASALSGFIGAYNGVIGFLNAQFAHDPASGKNAPPLNGDSAARQVQRSLKQFVTGRLPGLAGDTISALSEIGFTSDEKTGLLSFNSATLDSVLRDDPDAVRRILTRFGEKVSGNFSFIRRSHRTQPGIYEVEITQARTRGQIAGLGAAGVLGQDEQLTISYTSRATRANDVPRQIQVDLLAGDTPAVQVQKIQQAFDANDIEASVFLDVNGALQIRTTGYGADQQLTVQSDVAAGADTTNLGDALRTGTGTDLRGLIGGRNARVLDGNRLKGESGFATEDIEVLIPDDVSGKLGKVRIADGLAESLPDVIDGLTTGRGILASRTQGLATTITSLEEQFARSERRLEKVEDRLRRQFTNLEVQMGQLNALGEYVSQQLAALTNINKKK